jgi:aminotransferase
MSEKLEMVRKSFVRDLFDRASRMRDTVNLSIGEPDFDTPLHIKKAAKEALESGFTKYTPTQGIPELREAISEKFMRENGINATTDEILVSVSANQLIFYTLASLLHEGDEVLIQSPMFVSYAPQVKITGGTQWK